MNRNRIIQLGLIIGILCMCLPTVMCTLYTYPVQDDFYNTWNVGLTMQEGYSAFGASLLKAIRGWSDYSGYYFSLFLTYFSDAIIYCSIWGIRICQFIMAIGYYTGIFLFIRTIVVKVFGYEEQKGLSVIFLFFMCVTSLYYFVDLEDLLWFCASVIYLIPMTFIFWGSICMIYVLNSGRYKWAILPMVLGFLAGGAVLNIAAFGCIVYVMTAYWGIVVKKKPKSSICMCMPMLFGGIINVVAPGNFVRKGSGLSIEEIWITAIGTYHYVLSRVKLFLVQYPLFAVVLVRKWGDK